MIQKLRIPRGRGRPDGTLERFADGEADVCDLERGLCLQYYVDPILAHTVAYGVTHHTGYRLTGPWFRYAEARTLQQALLALPIDWTADQKTLETLGAARAQAQALIQAWRHVYAAFVDVLP